MKLTSHTARGAKLADFFGAQVARVRMVLHHDPRIGADLPVKLRRTHIHRIDASRAPLKQTIGKAARGGTYIRSQPYPATSIPKWSAPHPTSGLRD